MCVPPPDTIQRAAGPETLLGCNISGAVGAGLGEGVGAEEGVAGGRRRAATRRL